MKKLFVQWATRILALAVALGVAPAAFAVPKGQIAAYVWIGDAGANQAPSASYSFNAANKSNTVKKTGIGTYEVKLAGVGTAGGHAVVSAYGTGATHCKIVRWNAAGSDQVVLIGCFNGATAADSQFSLLFVH